MIDTGADFGHAAVVTKVNNNGTVDVIEANYYSPGAIGTRKNVPTIGIAGYYVPSSSNSTNSSSSTSTNSSTGTGNILTKTADTVSA